MSGMRRGGGARTSSSSICSKDEFNDESINPVNVPDAQLHLKIQAARAKYHENLVDRFDTHVPLETK